MEKELKKHLLSLTPGILIKTSYIKKMGLQFKTNNLNTFSDGWVNKIKSQLPGLNFEKKKQKKNDLNPKNLVNNPSPFHM
jgi:hypothetical protein